MRKKTPEVNSKVTTSLKVNPELWRKIKALAALRGIDLSALIEQLITDELDKEEKKGK